MMERMRRGERRIREPRGEEAGEKVLRGDKYAIDGVGDLIRRQREKLGISQASLAEGICSPSTLSRVELGLQQPEYRLMVQVFERLGMPVEFCWSCRSTQEYLTEQLKHRLYRSLELGLIEEDPDWLWTLERLASRDDLEAAQYLDLLGILRNIQAHLDLIQAEGAYPFPRERDGSCIPRSCQEGCRGRGILEKEGEAAGSSKPEEERARGKLLQEIQDSCLAAIRRSRPDFVPGP